MGARTFERRTPKPVRPRVKDVGVWGAPDTHGAYRRDEAVRVRVGKHV